MSLSEVSIKLNKGLDGFLSIKEQWGELAKRNAYHFLHFPGWYEAHLRSYSSASDGAAFDNTKPSENVSKPPSELLFVTLSDKEGLAAVIPFQLSSINIKGFSISVLLLAYPNEMGVSDAFSRIDLADYRQSIFAHLRQAGIKFSIVKHNWVLTSSSALSSGLASTQVLAKPSHVTKFLDLSAGREDFYSQYSGKFKRDLRRKLKKAHELGEVTHKKVSDASELQDAYQHFLALEDSGWKGEGGTSIVKQPDKIAYYDSLYHTYSELGLLRINLLYIGDDIAAAQFGIEIKGVLYLLKIAYNEAFATISPGYLLIDKLIEIKESADRLTKLSFVTGVSWIDRWKPSEENVWVTYDLGGAVKNSIVNSFYQAYTKYKSQKNNAKSE